MENQEKITFTIFIITLYTWILVAIFLLVEYFLIMPFLLLFSLFEKKPKNLIYNFIRGLVKFYMFCFFPSEFKIDLKEITPIDGPRVYVLNHASNFDTFLMYLLPGRIRVLVKENYLKIPFIGWNIRLTDNIVVRKPKHSHLPSDPTDKALEMIRQNAPILIFPEGTRSRNGNIGRFKTGGFKIAYETKAEIVPIVLDTWNSIRPGGGWWIRDWKVWMKALKPYSYEEYNKFEMKEFSKMIKNEMTEELLRIRQKRMETEKDFYRNADKYRELDKKAQEKLLAYRAKNAPN